MKRESDKWTWLVTFVRDRIIQSDHKNRKWGPADPLHFESSEQSDHSMELDKTPGPNKPASRPDSADNDKVASTETSSQRKLAGSSSASKSKSLGKHPADEAGFDSDPERAPERLHALGLKVKAESSKDHKRAKRFLKRISALERKWYGDGSDKE